MCFELMNPVTQTYGNTAEMRLMNYLHIYDWANIFSDGNMFNHAVFINCKILEELIHN